MIPLLILALSAASVWFMASLLALPYRPEQELVAVPTFVAYDVPDATFDWIGLV